MAVCDFELRVRTQDSDAFCSGTLCEPEMSSYIADNFVAWGGDVRFSDAASVRHFHPKICQPPSKGTHVPCRLFAICMQLSDMSCITHHHFSQPGKQ